MTAVRLAHPLTRVMGGRAGTAIGTLDQLRAMFGPPTYEHCDDKVTASWVFVTPRGHAEVRDYWWNGPKELSIGAASNKAAMWLCKFLRTHGMPASTRSKQP